MGWSSGDGGGGDSDDTIDPEREEPERKDRRQDLPREYEGEPNSYFVEAKIGEGGMGAVFAAADRQFGRMVAVKQLLPGRDEGRFLREARITARLQHPGIVAVYAGGSSPTGEPFYAMRQIVGGSLDKAVKACETLKKRTQLLPNIIAAGNALAYAHSQGVIHRDVKPKNILVGEFGETVVIDWGLAKDLAASPERPSQQMPAVTDVDTRDGQVVGTAAYMPPEQARGESVDERADVYAVGALLYFVLAGVPPYRGKKTLEQVKRGPPPSLASVQPEVPRDLVSIVEKAMQRDPDDRYATVDELVDELERFLTGQIVNTYNYSRLERARRFISRNRAVLGVAVAALVTLAVIAVVSVRRIIAEREYAETQRAELLEEQGRAELEAGRSGRALAYLGAAIELGHSTPAMRLLIAEARRPFDKQETVIDAHGGKPVRSVAFSPDDRRLLSVGDDDRAFLWSPDGAKIAELGHGDAVYSAAFARRDDGDRIATASKDGTAALWSLDGERVATLPHPAPVLDARFSAFGEHLVTAGADGKARVWSVASSALTATLEHGRPLIMVAISEDGQRVLGLDKDGLAVVWTGRDHKVELAHGAKVASASLSTDSASNQVVTAGKDRVARVWDAATGRPLVTLQGHADEVVRAVFRQDDEQILTASRDRTARVFDAKNGALLATMDGHFDAVTWAGLGHHQKHVLTASNDGVVRLWDSGAQQLRFEGHAGGVNAAAFDHAGELVASAGQDGTVRTWQAASPRLRSRLETQLPVVSVDVSRDGTRLLTGSRDHTAVLWDATKRPAQPREIAEEDETILAVAFSPSGRTAAIGSVGRARIVPLAGGPSIELKVDESVYAVAFDPTGSRVATAGGTENPDSGIVRVFDAASGRQLGAVEHARVATGVRFSSDGARLITASADETAKIVRLAELSAAPAVVHADMPLSGAVLLDDGYILCGDAGARVTRGVAVVPLEGAGEVDSCELRPDGAVIATASADRVIRLWNADTGKLLTTRERQTGRLSLRFSADGEALVSASLDGTALVWDVAPDRSSAAEIRELLGRVPWRLVDNRLERKPR